MPMYLLLLIVLALEPPVTLLVMTLQHYVYVGQIHICLWNSTPWRILVAAPVC